MSKKAFEEKIRKRVYEIGFGSYYAPSEEHTFLLELSRMHPCKEWGCEIKGFHLMPNAFNPQYIHMEAETTQGNVPFSWVKCMKQQRLPPREKVVITHLKQAMRNAVSKDTIPFKQQYDILTCALCGITSESKSPTHFHTDHKDVPFSKIANDFIALYVEPTEFDICKKTRTKVFKAEDAEYESTFYDYHKERATYQILCDSCNIRKSNKVI